jgi:hypothetical protein
MKLGEILVKQGLLSRTELADALAHQHAQGARLGAYLVENEILSSDQVALALAEQFGVAPALEADFARADASLRKRMVAHQAIELQAIPLFLINGRRVAVAMANPTNSRALERLAFVLGATVEPLVASDVAMERQFEILYRVRRKHAAPPGPPKRKEADARGPTPTQQQPSRSSESSEIRPALRSYVRRARPPKLAPLKPGQSVPEPCAPVTMMEDALCFTPTPLSSLPRAKVRMPPPPSHVVARHALTPIVAPINEVGAQLAVDQVRLAADQQDLSDSLFTLMRAYFGVGALFAVQGVMARGLFGFSGGRVRPEVERLRFSLSLPSCFRIARSRRGTFRGSPPPDGGAVQAPLWTALRSQPPNDVLVSPIIVDGAVTLLLYAQSDPGGRINDLAASKMRQVCEALGSSLVRLAG